MTGGPLDNDLLDDILERLKAEAPRRFPSVKTTKKTHLACSLREFVLKDTNTMKSVAPIGSICWDGFKMQMASAANSLTVDISMGYGSEEGY
jgi:hypothetical protein